MASQENYTQDDEVTLVDETPFGDHRDVYFDKEELSYEAESSRKRKQPKKATKVSQKKEKKVDDEDKNEGNEPKRVGKERAECWKHFDVVFLEEEDGVIRKHGRCKYCKKEIKADPKRNGTSDLKNHINACNENPEDKKQSILVFRKETCGECSVNIWKHDKSRIYKTLLDLMIVGELPFKLVEYLVFIEYTNALNEKFTLPSQHKLSRDIGKYYVEERKKLLEYVSKPTKTVHLTTDSWTSSCQRVNYMVVTAHFIDYGWVMLKHIINFRPVRSHIGDDIGQELLHCIHGWGIKNVMAMMVDNVSSNDKAIDYLLRKLSNLYDGGRHFHIRCMAHILNLSVKDGLSENNYHVEFLRKTIRYIRNSTQRISKFKKCMEESNVESSKFLCGDMPTRWNSMYEMLKTTMGLREVFFAYELEDDNYKHDFKRQPEHSDFGACESLVKF